jgi:hypothetical protein
MESMIDSARKAKMQIFELARKASSLDREAVGMLLKISLASTSWLSAGSRCAQWYSILLVQEPTQVWSLTHPYVLVHFLQSNYHPVI